jgi:hypothetical protein
MAKEPAYVRDLREYAKGDLSSDYLRAFEEELYGQNDCATAILYAALVDNALVRLISKQMRGNLNSTDRRELFETFDRKISLAYALKLIGPVSRSDLDLIRFMRNQFAHSRLPLRFSTPEVGAVCAALQFPELPGVELPIGPLDLAAEMLMAKGMKVEDPRIDARSRYIMSCHNLAARVIIVVDAPPDVPPNYLACIRFLRLT